MEAKLSNILDVVRAKLPRGACYQRALLAGEQVWSGADLAGKAAKYGGHYAGSREALCSRVNGALAAAGWFARVWLVLSGTGRDRRWRREIVFGIVGQPATHRLVGGRVVRLGPTERVK